MRGAFRKLAVPVCVGALMLAWASARSAGTAPLPAVFALPADQPTISLNGLWRFKPGDDAHFADAALDDSGWSLLRSDEPWTQQGYAALTGYGWYRFRVEVPVGSGRASLLLPAISSGYECFIDGKLAHAEGTVPGRGVARYAMAAAIELPPKDPTHAQSHLIALRVWFNPRLDGSADEGPDSSARLASLGDSSAAENSLTDFYALERQGATQWLASSLLFILAGILCAALFLMKRSNREFLWYAVAATSYGLSLGLSYDQLSRGWPISAYLLATSICNAGTTVGLTLFFSYLLRIKRNWFTAVLIGAVLTWSFTGSLQDAGLVRGQTDNLVSALIGCVFASWVIAAVVRRAWQRELDAMLLLAPVTFDFGLVFTESLRQEFPTALGPIAAMAAHLLWAYPFPVRLRNLSAVFVLLSLVLVLLNRFRRIGREHDRITADMRAARSIQHLLIPDVLPAVAGLRIAAAYHPAQEVGGDFFQVVPAGPDKTLIVLGDVSGKGLPAAMTVSLVVGVIRTLVEFTTSPGAILAGLNARLVGRGAGFTTCLAIEIERDGTLVFANAGQLAPYRNGVEIASEAGLPLGILPDQVYPESTLRLALGDRLTLMTDGVPEAASDGEMFGFARSEQLSQQPAEKIADAARLFGQTDDITVVSIEFCGTGAGPGAI